MEDGELSVTLNGLIVMLVLSVPSYSTPQEVVCFFMRTKHSPTLSANYLATSICWSQTCWTRYSYQQSLVN